MKRPKKFLFGLIYDPDRLTGFFKLSAEKELSFQTVDGTQDRSRVGLSIIFWVKKGAAEKTAAHLFVERNELAKKT